MAIYLGIDPGLSGGIATIKSDGTIDSLIAMPRTDKDIWGIFEAYKEIEFAVIEKVGSMPGNAAARMFRFGSNVGMLKAFLVATKIPFEETRPMVWQRILSIPKHDKSESKSEWKNRLKNKAQQLFPDSKITLATADALLIAEYCRRVHGV